MENKSPAVGSVQGLNIAYQSEWSSWANLRSTWQAADTCTSQRPVNISDQLILNVMCLATHWLWRSDSKASEANHCRKEYRKRKLSALPLNHAHSALLCSALFDWTQKHLFYCSAHTGVVAWLYNCRKHGLLAHLHFDACVLQPLSLALLAFMMHMSVRLKYTTVARFTLNCDYCFVFFYFTNIFLCFHFFYFPWFSTSLLSFFSIVFCCLISFQWKELCPFEPYLRCTFFGTVEKFSLLHLRCKFSFFFDPLVSTLKSNESEGEKVHNFVCPIEYSVNFTLILTWKERNVPKHLVKKAKQTLRIVLLIFNAHKRTHCKQWRSHVFMFARD